MRKNQVMSIIFICVVLAALSFHFLWRPDSTIRLSPLTCTFLKVGKADAVVLESNGSAMVIDTGEEDDGQEVVDHLKKSNVSKVDVLIITHYDKDHVGGADTLISQFPAARVLIPDYPGSSTECVDFMTALRQHSIEPEPVDGPLSFPFGDALVTVNPPKTYDVPPSAIE